MPERRAERLLPTRSGLAGALPGQDFVKGQLRFIEQDFGRPDPGLDQAIFRPLAIPESAFEFPGIYLRSHLLADRLVNCESSIQIREVIAAKLLQSLGKGVSRRLADPRQG